MPFAFSSILFSRSDILLVSNHQKKGKKPGKRQNGKRQHPFCASLIHTFAKLLYCMYFFPLRRDHDSLVSLKFTFTSDRIGVGTAMPSFSLRRLETRGVKSQRKWVNSNGVLVRLFYVKVKII